MKNKVLFLALAILGASSLKAQLNVGSTSAADASAILQATSTTKGFLPPSMTTAQIAAIALPAKGLTVYDNQLNQLKVNVGTPAAPSWAVGAGAANVYWSQSGNTGTVPGTNYLGTTDNVDLTLATNSVERMRIDALGKVGIGTTAPAAGLDVVNNMRLGTTVGGANTDSILTINAAGIINKRTVANVIGSNWGTTGNTGTVPNTNYIGTTDNVSIAFRTNGVERMRIDSSTGQVTIPGRLALGNGLNNLYIGTGTGAVSTANSNQFVGIRSGLNNTTGANNTFSGYQSGLNNTTGFENTFNGFSSGSSNTTGIRNVFDGRNAGTSNTTGSENVFLGWQSGTNNTVGGNNTYLGRDAGANGNTGNSNTFGGARSGLSVKSGSNNVFLGFESGFNDTVSNNQFIGYQSGYNNVSGSSNTFSGYQSGIVNTTGSFNTINGYLAGGQNTTGNANVFIGHNSGYNNTIGTNNTAIGIGAGPATGALTNTTAIGNGASATQSNTVILGNNAINVGIGTTAPAAKLDVAGNMRLGTTVSGAATDSILTINSSTGIINARSLPSIVQPTIFGVSGQAGFTTGIFVTAGTGALYTGWSITIPASSKYIIYQNVLLEPNTSYVANSSLLINLTLSTSTTTNTTTGIVYGNKGTMYLLANANNSYQPQMGGSFMVQNTTTAPITLYLWLGISQSVNSYGGSIIVLNPGQSPNSLYGIPIN